MGAAPVWVNPRDTELETLFELGRGGMGTAYLARALGAGGFERLVVIKRLGLELYGLEGALERFLAEARVAASLHHVNIVGTHQVDRDAGGPFMVLDYVEGGSLDDLIEAATQRGERVPVPVLLRIVEDALAGLHAVHEATDAQGRSLRILHRDVSIQNVLVGVHDGVTRLSDFGVAKSVLSLTQTNPGSVVGKVLYLPPEYLRGEAVDQTLDIYALGMTLWLTLAGEEPWPDASDLQLAQAIVAEGVPSLSGRVKVAPEVQALVERACARDPRERFQSAREMSAVLEQWERQRGWVATHAEVAACVERLLGDVLRARREEIARLASAPAVPIERARTLPAPAQRLEPQRLELSRVGPQEIEPRRTELRRPDDATRIERVPPRPRRVRASLAFAAALAVLAPGAWFSFERWGYGHARVTTPRVVLVTPPPSARTHPPVVPEPSAVPTLASFATTSPAVVPTPTSGTKRSEGTGISGASAEPTLRREVDHPPRSAQPPPVAPGVAPIRVKNPYR